MIDEEQLKNAEKMSGVSLVFCEKGMGTVYCTWGEYLFCVNSENLDEIIFSHFLKFFKYVELSKN